MTIIFAVFCIISLYHLEPCLINDNYLSRKQTQSINGIFVFLVFLSHFAAFVKSDFPFSNGYLQIRAFLRQMVVVTFLFFSGYGMYESFKKKGKAFIYSIPNRFFKLLIRFDMAIVLYLILAIFLGQELTLKKVVLSFLAWDALGNSNWYVFTMLSLYIVMYLSFLIGKCKPKKSILIFIFGSVILVYLLRISGKEGCWYNTALCFTFGVIFSYFKDYFIKLLEKSNIIYFVILALSIYSFYLLYPYMYKNFWGYEIAGMCFCMIVVVLSHKLKFNNPILYWLGEHTFSIYILQKIPMLIGRKIGLISYPVIYFCISLICTLLLAHFFDLLCIKGEHMIHSRN